MAGRATGAVWFCFREGLLDSGIHKLATQAETPLRQRGVDPRFTDRERQPGLDLLRALAIVVVVIYHAGIMGFPLSGNVHRFGWIGVDLFFVLSGYLIGGQLLAPLLRGQRIYLGTFFARRALRIMPAYFVVLAIYFLLPSLREYPEMSQPLWKFLLSVQNIALHGGTAFSHAWSLAVEDQFYLVLPFLFACPVCTPTHVRDRCLHHRFWAESLFARSWRFRISPTREFRSAVSRRGFIIRPGPDSIRLCLVLLLSRSKNSDQAGGKD